jgi:hypothetical protein
MDKQLRLERTASTNRGSYLRKLHRRFFLSLRTRKRSRQFNESSYDLSKDITKKSDYSHIDTMSKVVGATTVASCPIGKDPPAYTVNPSPAFLLGPAKSPRKPPSFKKKSNKKRASPHSATNKQQQNTENLIVSKRESVAASRDVYLVGIKH